MAAISNRKTHFPHNLDVGVVFIALTNYISQRGANTPGFFTVMLDYTSTGTSISNEPSKQ